MMKIYQKALNLQLLYVFLVVVWNATGLWQTQQGVQSIGPVASITVIAIALMTGLSLICMTRRGLVKSYFAFSFLVLLIASLSVYRAFSDDPGGWPSDLWRYVGAAINAIGVVSFIVLVISRFNTLHNTK